MTEIGKLRSLDNVDPLRELRGRIATIDFEIEVLIVRNDDTPMSDQSPTHTVYCEKADGRRVEIGKGWSKTAMRGTRPGEEFLSVTLDSPSWPNAISFAIFRQDDGHFSAVWRRRQSS